MSSRSFPGSLYTACFGVSRRKEGRGGLGERSANSTENLKEKYAFAGFTKSKQHRAV